MIGQKWLRKIELKKKEIRYESKIDGILMKYAWVCNDVSKTIKSRAHQITTHTDEPKFYATMSITKSQTILKIRLYPILV